MNRPKTNAYCAQRRATIGRPPFKVKRPAQGGAGVNDLRVLENHYDLE